MNAYWEPLSFELPPLDGGAHPWRRRIDTFLDSPHDIVGWEQAPEVRGTSYRVEPRSVVILFANAADVSPDGAAFRHGPCSAQRAGSDREGPMLREIPVRRDCPQCGHVDFSAAVSVIVVWAHGLTTAIPMIPKAELRICATGRCRAAYRLVSRAFDVHPETQATVGPWTRAVIVLEDGNGVEIHNSSGQILACA